jgi:molybdopterin adenylyltransferase
MTKSHAKTPELVRVATITFSDTRTPEDDEGGRLLGELLTEGGFFVVGHEIVREGDEEVMRDAVDGRVTLGRADAIVTTGGTGVSPRDRAIEALTPLFEKTLEGFGEAFRRLSWDEIGPRAIMSRATAGVVRGRVVIALPGSPAAVRLAVEKLIRPTLAHLCGIAAGKGGKHAQHGEHGGSGA